MNTKLLKSGTGEPIYVATKDGHATWIGLEFKEVDERFHSEAFSLGAVQEGQSVYIPAKNERETEAEHITRILQEMLDAEGIEEHFFDANGLPEIEEVRKLLGYHASKEDILKSFYALVEIAKKQQDIEKAEKAAIEKQAKAEKVAARKAK